MKKNRVAKAIFYQISLVAITAINFGCVTSDSELDVSGKVFSIVTLDLYDQNDVPQNKRSWLGDWDFRRERLDVVDEGLREIRPDIFLFQNAMTRVGSESESDQSILKAGALQRYEWIGAKIREFAESGEFSYLVFGAQRPLSIIDVGFVNGVDQWPLGIDGSVAMKVVSYGSEKMLLVNVLMPSNRDQLGLWYSFVTDRIKEGLEKSGICKNRLIVAGYLPIDQESRKARSFAAELELADSAVGFCQNAEKCQTGHLKNEIFAVTKGSELQGQFDRVLLHKSALVHQGGLILNQPLQEKRFQEIYGITNIWATQRFGWSIRASFASCPK